MNSLLVKKIEMEDFKGTAGKSTLALMMSLKELKFLEIALQILIGIELLYLYRLELC